MSGDMTDRAMSETAMLASLRDIDLPAVAAGGVIADLAVTVGLAGLAALVVAGLLRLVSFRRHPGSPDDLRGQLAGLAQRPPEDRRVALLHLLRAHAPERYAAVKGRLYEPGGGVDIDTLEAEVARLV